MSTSNDNGTLKLMALQFLSGSMAACGAVTFTNPFDMLKTRRQLYNELKQLSTLQIKSPINMRLVYKMEGVRGLQKGLLAAYSYQILMNGTRFMVYEPLRLALIRATMVANSNVMCNALAGGMAGGIAAFIGSPFNLIKTRLQSYSPHFSTGYQHGYSGIKEAVSKIYTSEGVKGFYRGVSASIMRTTAGSATQLASYDWLKWKISEETGMDVNRFPLHFTSAMTSGVLACLVMNPFDVVMTRLYNQKEGSLYKGFLDCGVKTVRVEGFMALWKGLLPHYVRIGPHTVLTLVLLEQIRSTLKPFL